MRFFINGTMRVYIRVAIRSPIPTASTALISAVLPLSTLLIVFYTFWMKRYVLPRLQPSEEALSLQESMTSQARTHSAMGLWLMEIAALTFVGFGILIFVVDPSNRLVAIASTVFFALCAANSTRLLILRGRATTNQP